MTQANHVPERICSLDLNPGENKHIAVERELRGDKPVLEGDFSRQLLLLHFSLVHLTQTDTIQMLFPP